MKRVVVLQAAGFPIFAQRGIAHHFRDVRQIPARQIRRMTQAAEKPFERSLFRPRLYQKPAVVSVVSGFDGVQFAERAGEKMFALTIEWRKKTRALADENLPAAFLLCVEHIFCTRQIIQKRLGADDVLAGLQRLDGVLGVQMIGRVDADGIHGFVREQFIKRSREMFRRQGKFAAALRAKLRVDIAQLCDFPQPAVHAGRNDAAAFAKTEDTEAEFFHGRS